MGGNRKKNESEGCEGGGEVVRQMYGGRRTFELDKVLQRCEARLPDGEDSRSFCAFEANRIGPWHMPGARPRKFRRSSLNSSVLRSCSMSAALCSRIACCLAIGWSR